MLVLLLQTAQKALFASCSNLGSSVASHVLITGGAGFIGSNTAAHYLERGAQVTIFETCDARCEYTGA